MANDTQIQGMNQTVMLSEVRRLTDSQLMKEPRATARIVATVLDSIFESTARL